MKSRLLASLLLPLGTLVLASTALAATTWYVNGTSGSDSNACLSATTACKTIGHAISLAASGDTIRVAAGDYLETLTINSTLTLIGAGPRKSVVGGLITVFGGALGHPVTLSGFDIRNGSGTNGGAIANYGHLLVVDTFVLWSNAKITGGGISTSGGSLDIEKSVIAYNKAPQGGGISCFAPSGTVRITNTVIAHNTATEDNGGGIMSACHMEIINSTIANNRAINGYGGGYYAIDSTLFAPYFANATIANNVASVAGGGLFGPAVLEDTVIAGNRLYLGGFSNCGTKVGSDGYNISDDDTCNLNFTGDLNNTQPGLGPLSWDTTGTTMVMAIGPGSPAIDAGNPKGCPVFPGASAPVLVTDQRGDRRPGDPKLKTGCDIGAYEYQFPR